MVEQLPHQQIINVLSESMHLRFGEAVDSSAGITQPEHHRRHYLWVSGLLAGMGLAFDYPKLAAAMWLKVKDQPDVREFALPFVDDFIAREVGERVFDKGKPNEAALEAMAKDVETGARNTNVVPDRAVFTNEGVLSWLPRKAGEWPLETWHDTWEDWGEVQ